MSTNPVRLEWTEQDEREFLRERAQLQQEYFGEPMFDRDFTNITDEFGPIYHD